LRPASPQDPLPPSPSVFARRCYFGTARQKLWNHLQHTDLRSIGASVFSISARLNPLFSNVCGEVRIAAMAEKGAIRALSKMTIAKFLIRRKKKMSSPKIIFLMRQIL
jgi:hypothetical protein